MILHYNYVTLHLHVHFHYHLHSIDYIAIHYITLRYEKTYSLCCLESCYIHYIHYISYIQHMLATCEALGVQEDH